MIRHWPAESGPKDSTKDQACANETDHMRRKMKLSDDQRHCHAKNEDYEAIE